MTTSKIVKIEKLPYSDYGNVQVFSDTSTVFKQLLGKVSFISMRKTYNDLNISE